MIMHAIDPVVAGLLMAAARENMNLMPATIEGRCQLRDVNADAADGDAVQRLPGKQRYLHDLSPCLLRIHATGGFPSLKQWHLRWLPAGKQKGCQISI